MAIAIAEPAAIYIDSSDASIYTSTNTWTPAANDVIVGFISATGTTLASPTLTSLSETWTLQTSATFNSGVNTIYCFTTAITGTPTLTTPVFNCTGDSATGCIMAFLTFTGADTSSPVVQTKIKNSTTGSNPSIIFDASLNTNNGYAFASANTANPYTMTSAPTGWSIFNDTGHGSPTAGFWDGYRAGGESGTTITATRGSINHGIIGIEIKATSSASVTSIWGNLQMMGVG